MNALGEPLKLQDGRMLVVTEGAHGLVLEAQQDGRTIDSLVLPPRSEGVGGARLISSPSGRLLVVSFFSGQSEEGYELVELGARLRMVASQAYVFGEEASYAFSPSERTLAMIYPFACSEWWLGFDEDDPKVMPNGSTLFDFGELRIRGIPEGKASRHLLQVELPAGWQAPESSDWDSDLAPRFVSEDRLAVSLPWGLFTCTLPSPDRMLLPGPVTRA